METAPGASSSIQSCEAGGPEGGFTLLPSPMRSTTRLPALKGRLNRGEGEGEIEAPDARDGVGDGVAEGRKTGAGASPRNSVLAGVV